MHLGGIIAADLNKVLRLFPRDTSAGQMHIMRLSNMRHISPLQNKMPKFEKGDNKSYLLLPCLITKLLTLISVSVFDF